MGIVIVACTIWISCDNNMQEMYKLSGSNSSYYYDDSLGWSEGPTNESDTGFWAGLQQDLWQKSLDSQCQEVGGYVFVNSSTGEMKIGNISYGEANSGTLIPGSSSPKDNGLSSDWSATAYVHTHYASDCVGKGNMRGVGPSNADQEWADKHGMPVYTIDYEGTYYETLDDYYISYSANRYSRAIWYSSNPKY